MDTSLLQALAKLETQDGRKSIKGPNGEDSYNLFNIKDLKGTGFRAFDKAEGSRDAYRTYGSREESIQDLVGLLERKYPKAHAALASGDADGFANGLKEGGYATDPKYVEKLTKTIASVRSARPVAAAVAQPQGTAAEQAVTASAAAGGTAVDQLVGLREAGFDDVIRDALNKGYKPDEIVKYIAGNAQATGKEAADKRAAQGFGTNAIEGATDTVKRLWRGGQQVLATGDEEAALKAEEAADRANPDNIALRSTAGAKVGSVAPLVGAAFIPGANTLVGGSALGATMAALQPTVEGESRTENALIGGATGGGAVAGGAVLSKALNAATAGVTKGLRGGQSVADVQKLIDDAQAQGLSVSARDVSPFLNKVANDAERVIGGKIGQVDRGATREQELARALTARLGKESDTLDSTVIKQAQDRIGSQFDNALDGVSLDGSTLATKLDEVVANQQKGLASLQSGLPSRVAEELKAKFAAGPVSARELQQIRSTVGRELTSPALDPASREGLSQINSSITKAIEEALPPAKLAQWQQANSQWRHLQASENVVRSTNDTGDITAKKLASAIKNGKFRSAYEKGEAPYQDLQRAMSSLESGGRGVISSGLDSGSIQALSAYATGGTSLIGAGVTANMALRLLNSTNPRVRSMVLGMNPVKQAELRRLALAGAMSTMN